jgi:hypothetical protein
MGIATRCFTILARREYERWTVMVEKEGRREERDVGGGGVTGQAE